LLTGLIASYLLPTPIIGAPDLVIMFASPDFHPCQMDSTYDRK